MSPKATSKRRRKRRHRLWPWLVLFLGLPALSVGFWIWTSHRPSKKNNNKKPVRRADGKSKQAGRSRDKVLATGVVRPQVGAEVKVGTRISGKVETVRAAIGHQVKKGEVLARLETDELKAAVKKAKAASAAAWSKLALLRRGSRNEEIASAEAMLKAALSVKEDAERELKRRRALLEKKLISREEVDHAQRDLAVATSKWKEARNTLDLKRKRYLPEEINWARAKAVEAQAALEMTRIRLDYATIRAPIDGVVATVSIQNGETVSAGLRSPTLVTIIDLERLQVEAYVDEVDIGQVAVGRQATFTVDTYPNEVFKGKVQAIYPKAVLEDNVVNYLTIISFQIPKATLRPGMTTNVTIQAASPRKNKRKKRQKNRKSEKAQQPREKEPTRKKT